MPRLRSLLCACLLLPLYAHAETTLEVAIQSAQGSGTQTFHLAGQQLRMDIQMGLSRSSVLYDASTDNLTLIDHQEQAFVRVTPEQATRLGQSSAAPSNPPRIVATEQTQVLGGNVECRVYQIYLAEQLSQETCLVDYGRLGLSEAEYQVFAGLLNALDRMAGNGNGKAPELVGKIPLRTVDYIDGQQSEIAELRLVRRGNSGVSFQVPGGYVEESPF